MAKVQQKSEKITAFGGIFFVLDKFDSILSSVIDSHLGLRSTLIGYQYSEIIRAIFSVFCCGGDCMEDLNLYLKDVLTERPHTRVPSADTVLRGIEELATENISYTAEKTGNVYDFNTAEKLNQLLIKLLLATGQLTEGGAYDVDFDHQFLEADKYDSKRTYKGFDGYSPGVFTIGGLKVADYMKKNPSARFEVQGHTDSQGSDKVNDPLSQQRAEAIVTALVSLGVDAFNLRAVGKGSHEPVADNKTEEGRAQNRRVEFIKK